MHESNQSHIDKHIEMPADKRVIALNVSESVKKHGKDNPDTVLSYTQRGWRVSIPRANRAELIFACDYVADGWEIIGVYEFADGERWLPSQLEPGLSKIGLWYKS